MLYSLRALRDCGLQICVISAGDGLAPGEADKLLGLADALLIRDNGGLDWSSWQAAMALGLAEGFPHVLLANDSVYGPLRPLQPFLDSARRSGIDAWGMVESRAHGWHLQSWFMMLTAEALARPAVAGVLASDFAAMNKKEIITIGEVGLGAALMSTGAVCDAASRAVPAPLAQRRWPVNRMHFDWFRLAASGAVPFLKVELLRDNPLGIAGVRRWRDALRGSDYPPALIENHLLRLGPRQAAPRVSWKKRAQRRVFALLVSSNRMRILSGG